jgi:hypothetical protein
MEGLAGLSLYGALATNAIKTRIERDAMRTAVVNQWFMNVSSNSTPKRCAKALPGERVRP